MRVLVGGISNPSNVAPSSGISNAQSYSNIQNTGIMKIQNAISSFSCGIVFRNCENSMGQVEHLECSRILIEALQKIPDIPNSQF